MSTSRSNATRGTPRKKAAIDRIVETAIFLQAESRRLAKAECQKHDISATQLNILKLLEEIGDLSLSEVSKHLAANNSTVTGIVDRMETAGLVKRERSSEDRRVWKLKMTARGRGIAAKLDVGPWNLLRSALDAMPTKDIDRLIDTLDRIAAHVAEKTPRGTASGKKKP